MSILKQEPFKGYHTYLECGLYFPPKELIGKPIKGVRND